MQILISTNIVSDYIFATITTICINIILAVSLNLITGFYGSVFLGACRLHVDRRLYLRRCFDTHAVIDRVYSWAFAGRVGRRSGRLFGGASDFALKRGLSCDSNAWHGGDYPGFCF